VSALTPSDAPFFTPAASESNSDSAAWQSNGDAGVGVLGLALIIGAAVLVAVSLLIAFLVRRIQRAQLTTPASSEELASVPMPSCESLFAFDNERFATQANPIVSTHWDECLFTDQSTAGDPKTGFLFLE
jgi:hypothetical protein